MSISGITCALGIGIVLAAVFPEWARAMLLGLSVVTMLTALWGK